MLILLKVHFQTISLDGNYIDRNLSSKVNVYKKTRVDMQFWSEAPRLFLEFFVIIIMIGILVFIKIPMNYSSL